ncbi:MAG: hypothetical protein OEY03_03820 [Rhizobacter sp.]|nr:hypothetical protein [Rhizobacter sp.]
MIKVARAHTLFGLVFAVIGMGLGIYMAASHDHGQHVTHAHVLLLGLVVSLLYGMVCRLWRPEVSGRLAKIQLVLHQVGTLLLVAGLYMLYGAVLPEPSIAPLLGIASLAVLGAAVLMLFIFVRGATPVATANKPRWQAAQEPS